MSMWAASSKSTFCFAHLKEFVTVLFVIDVLGISTQNWHVLCIQMHYQVVWNLTTGRYDLWVVVDHH